MALGKNLWRPFPCDAWEWLQDHEPLAQRLLLWMWTGPDSSASGLVRLREYSAAGALKSKPAAIRKALDELAQAGRVVVGASASGRHDVWLDRYLTSQAGINSDHRQLIKREIEAFANGLPRAQAIEDWRLWDAAYDKAGKRMNVALPQAKHTEQNRTEQNRTVVSVPKGTDTPAVASMVQNVAIEDDEPPPFDWSTIAPTPDPYLDPDYRPEVRLTPEAQARIDKLKAEQAQQTLTLTAPKPSKNLTPAQQDAIFAKKRMAATVDLWNELLGKTTCGPCSHKEVAKMATQLMSNLAKYVSSEPGRDGSALIGWANAKSEYHSGRTGRTWTLQKWLTTEHLAQVFADYRNERGDERKIRYLPERTLRDWREAEEAREAWVNSQQGQVAA